MSASPCGLENRHRRAHTVHERLELSFLVANYNTLVSLHSLLEFPTRKKNNDSHMDVLIPSMTDSEGFFLISLKLFEDFTHCFHVPTSPPTAPPPP